MKTEFYFTSPEFSADCLHWRHRVLTGKYAHWCYDWDGLPVDETCGEFTCCTCFESTGDFLAAKQQARDEYECHMEALSE